MPTWATALGIGTCGMAVAAERGPSADRHHATLNVPRDEQRLPDAQHEHDGLVLRLGRPPRVRHVGAYAGVGFNGTSVQLEFPFAAVRAGHSAGSTYRGSRRMSAAFADHVMAPTSRRPFTRYGSTGLMRGDPSRRSVPSIATRAALNRAAPSRAISGAPVSTSRQSSMPAAPAMSVTLLLVRGSLHTKDSGRL